jgi:hypothetical protein
MAAVFACSDQLLTFVDKKTLLRGHNADLNSSHPIEVLIQQHQFVLFREAEVKVKFFAVAHTDDAA